MAVRYRHGQACALPLNKEWPLPDESDKTDLESPRGATASDPALGSQVTPLNLDQLRSWAALIAAGDAEFPDDLMATDVARLQAATRKLLKERLVGVIARAIAADICRERDRNTESLPND